MSDISAIAAAVLISQSEVERQMSVSMIRMNAQADQAVADMVTQNARQIQALSIAVSGHIDLFV
jgi:hypothetical protein